jgi:hypothetical protein
MMFSVEHVPECWHESRMWNRLLVISCCAALGFAIAGGFYAWWTVHDYTKPLSAVDGVVMAANLVLCPPTLIFALCIDCEYGTPAGVSTQLVVVGLLNAVLYALIGGTFYKKIRKLRREG